MTELVREYDAGEKDGMAIVFVHGMGGDRRQTWMLNPGDTSSLWPLWLGRECGCDTWTVGYDADLTTWRDTASALHVQGLAVMDRLATEPELAGRPLLLIGHGVGGLLIKKIIAHALSKGGPRHRRMVGRIQGLAFVATPKSGAELNLLAQALCMRHGIPALDKDFAGEGAQLRVLQDAFASACSGLALQARVFAESKPVPIGRKWLGLMKVRDIVVRHDGANPHVPGATVTVLPEDHFSICKPKGPDAPLHRETVALIDACRASPLAAPISSRPEAPAMPVSLQENADIHVPVVRPARIENANDFRLQPCENKLYGRDSELTRILTFLDHDTERAAVVCPRTVDAGGLGKTELCKAALKIWGGRASERTVFYVDLPANIEPVEFAHLLASGIGVDDVANFEQLKTLLPPGLYFLDNIGSLAESEDGGRMLAAMRDAPGVRLLASSRRALPADFGQRIEIDALPKASALLLFRDLWSGGDVLPVDTVLAQFVDGELQRHALSICLVARLGDFFAYEEVVRRWRQHHVAALEDAGNRLSTSLRLTNEALSMRAGALPMWTFAAGFPNGVDEKGLEKFEPDGLALSATREFLQHHRILERRGNRYHVLAPLARFALGVAAFPPGKAEQVI